MTREEALKEQPRWEKMEKLLHNISNGPISYLWEEDLEKLIENGRPFNGFQIRLEKGTPSQCHMNVALLYEANKDIGFQIISGWAFDGSWVQHTWGLYNKKIVETTERRKAYFGYVLSQNEAKEFVYSNT